MKCSTFVLILAALFYNSVYAQTTINGKIESHIREVLLKELVLDSTHSLKLIVSKNDETEFSLINTLNSVLAYKIRKMSEAMQDSILKKVLPELERYTFDSLAQLDNLLNKSCKAAKNFVTTEVNFPDDGKTWVLFFSPKCNGHIYVRVVRANMIAYSSRGYEFYGEGFAFHFKMNCHEKFDYVFFDRVQYQ